MEGKVSHHDSTRSGVGRTAFGVAGLRANESIKPNPLISDEFAVKIMIENKVNNDEFLKVFQPQLRLDAMTDGLAVRTRKIDEEIIEELRYSAEKGENCQIVVIGAGLDFRPWRIHSYLSEETDRESILKGRKWFEIDFPEIFEFKSQYTKSATDGGTTKTYFDYHPITLNAAVDNWKDGLLSSGFNISYKTIWLLEGFTGYLTEDEVRNVFSILTSLSLKGNVEKIGSKLIATFLGPTCPTSLDMHRFKTAEPLNFVKEFGWGNHEPVNERKVESIQYNFQDLLTTYDRLPHAAWKDYYLVVACL
jgi:methyltransferase (TIGR00027 family)